MATPSPSDPPDADPAPERASRATTLALAVMSGAVKPLTTPETSSQARRFGVRLFPARAGDDPSRLELAALATALVGAAFVGSTLPGGSPVQAAAAPATPMLIAGAPLVRPTPTPAAPAGSGAADDAPSGVSNADAATGDLTPTSVTTTAATGGATATTDDASADGSGATDPEDGATGDGSDPLAGGGTTLARVALIVTHGDAPATWATAPAGSPAKQRAALGTTFTGLAVLPGAPLANGLAYVAGQPSNPATRTGCSTAQPVVPDATDEAGTATGTGCDYPAGASSVPGAIARDGRTWKAYTPAASPAEAAARLCHPYDGTAGDAATAAAQRGPLGHLGDLTGSGACDASAAPISQRAADLEGDNPPAWVFIDVGDCPPDGCSATAAADRDAALDAAITALRDHPAPDEGKSAIFVVGDGTAAAAAPAPTDSAPAGESDPAAPAPVASGALLIGDDVEAGATDPLTLDPLAIARTQATWLGVTAPGLAASDSATSLKLPGA